MCKQTANAPFCDGTHAKPEVTQAYAKQQSPPRFRVLGLQQIALGASDKAALSVLWQV
jgi:CDGSH-type Zn-finger protein